jgi:hypothetical protein
MNPFELLMAMVFMHFLADWTLQTRLVAENKLKYPYIMFVHCFVWTFCLFIPLMIMGYHIDYIIFVLMLAVHCFVDLWKCLVIRDWDKKENNMDNFKPWHLYMDQGIHLFQVVFIWEFYVYCT